MSDLNGQPVAPEIDVTTGEVLPVDAYVPPPYAVGIEKALVELNAKLQAHEPPPHCCRPEVGHALFAVAGQYGPKRLAFCTRCGYEKILNFPVNPPAPNAPRRRGRAAG